MPTLKTPPSCSAAASGRARRRRRRRRSRASARPSPKIRGVSPAREPRRGRSRRRRPRRAGPAAARRRSRSAAPRASCRTAGCTLARYSSPASFDDAVRARAAGARRSSGAGPLALAVDRAAGRARRRPASRAPAASSTWTVPSDVHLARRSPGRVDRDAHVRLRREVEADAGCSRRSQSSSGSRMSRLEQRAPRPGRSRACPVERSSSDEHLVAAREQRVDDVRADEARAPCDDRPHASVSYGRDVRDLRRARRLRQDHPGGAARRGARGRGREVVATREPGGTEVGERIRELCSTGRTMTPVGRGRALRRRPRASSSRR